MELPLSEIIRLFRANCPQPNHVRIFTGNARSALLNLENRDLEQLLGELEKQVAQLPQGHKYQITASTGQSFWLLPSTYPPVPQASGVPAGNA